MRPRSAGPGRAVSRGHARETGQALVEVIIWSALVLALVPGVVVLFKYAQMRQFSDQLVRYVLWERTVWSDPSQPWNGSAKGDQRVATLSGEVLKAGAMGRLSNPRLAMSSTRWADVEPGEGVEPADTVASTRLRPWRISPGERRLLRLAPEKAGALTTNADFSSSSIGEQWSAPEERLPGQVLAGSVTIPVLNLERGLDLNDSLVTASIDAPVKNLFGEWEGLLPLPLHALGGSLGEPMTMNVSGALLTNAWTPKNESVFVDKVHSLDVKPTLKYMTYVSSKVDDVTSIIPEPLKRLIPFLGPLTQAGNPELDASTARIPYIRALPWHIENESGADRYGWSEEWGGN